MNIDISNANNIIASELFMNCTNLTTIENIRVNNIIDFSGAFYGCANLINIPNFDTSKVTSMAQIFYGCRNLTSIPNFDTSNVTDAYRMFSYCSNLVDVPELNFINVTSVYRLFEQVSNNSLSDASINNIINMCLKAPNIPSNQKTFYNGSVDGPFGYSQISNTRFQNRWQELTDAGWTY